MSSLNRCNLFGVTDIRGVAYMPGPSDYTKTKGVQYFDSDFYNEDFSALWSPAGTGSLNVGRGDLDRFQTQLGVNFIHCYDWSAPVPSLGLRNHLKFLQECVKRGMKATIPISNYTYWLLSVGRNADAQTNIHNVFAEIYGNGQTPASGAGMWKIFNEYELWFDRNPNHVVTALSFLVAEEDNLNLPDSARLPIMIDTSFGVKDGIEGAGYLKDVWTALLGQSAIGSYSPADFWNARIVFSTNPQNDGPDVADYLANRLPQYWISRNVPIPPVMFTELGSSIQQTGSEQAQAEWMTRQLAASKPGASNGMMLGACVFLNEERPWEAGAERGFGISRFGPAGDWPWPPQNWVANTQYPQWTKDGQPYAAQGSYPVEQQAAKPNYLAVAKAWKA
jgi:hypothetical protein